MYPGQSVTGALISGYTASGVKLAGRHYRHLYGTREVAIGLLTGKKESDVEGCHEIAAVEKALQNTFGHDWAIDLDIKSFFDKIDHELLMKAVRHYCKDGWVLLYIERWLKAGTLQSDGNYVDRLTGTPQGGVISPLLANIFLHVVFDKWMEKYHPEKPFVRYADDIIVHCKTERQTQFVLSQIQQRLSVCKLRAHPQKTRIVNLKGFTRTKYPRSLDFLGFSLHPWWCKTGKGYRVMITAFISAQSVSKALDKFGRLKIHKWRKSIEALAAGLNPIIRGIKKLLLQGLGRTYPLPVVAVECTFIEMGSMGKGAVQESSPYLASQKVSGEPATFCPLGVGISIMFLYICD